MILGGSAADYIAAFPSLSSVLIGNGGDDVLQGSSARDILIGGLGADTLRGQGGDDVLIGGYSSFDNDVANLKALLAEWNSTRTYTQKVDNLRGGPITGVPLNGTAQLRTTGSQTVFDDAAVDTIMGSTGNDWFIAALDDLLADRIASEILDTLS